MFSNVLFPPPPPDPPRAEGENALLIPDGDGPPADGVLADPALSDPATAADEPGAPAADQPATEPARVADVPLEFVTLGSVDPASGYPMLVTITNRGAGVHRVELSDPRFRDEHDRSGYLGQIVFEDESDDDDASDAPAGDAGAVVGLVGAGTPAEKAGLEVGDRIVGLTRSGANRQPQEITSVARLQAALAKTSAGQTVTLDIVRGDQPAMPIEVTLGSRPLEVTRPEIENLRLRNAEIPAGWQSTPSFLLGIDRIDATPVYGDKLFRGDSARVKVVDDKPVALADIPLRDRSALAHANWEIVEHDQESATLRTVLPNLQLEITKRYSITQVPEQQRDDHSFPGYDIDLDVEIRNTGDKELKVTYVLAGPNGLPVEGWWFAHRISHSWGVSGLRDVVVRFENEGVEQVTCKSIVEDDAEPMGQGASLAYAAVDAQYFSAALIPKKESFDEVWFETTRAVRLGPMPPKSEPKTFTDVSFEVERQTQSIAAGGSLRDSYNIFLGPKRPELLKNYYAAGDPKYNLSDLIYYGWFGAIAKAMLFVLHFFYGFVGNYGIAIILLTVAVRAGMFPLSWKQTQSMARMQALKPELDKINEKYKNDAQKKQQAMQELYSKHQINPLSGCLPMFVQLPIFMGLYRGLMIDVELRGSPLFGDAIRWCSNLAAPDMLYDWSWFMPDMITSGHGMLSLGPYLNIFPLVTVALFLISQQMFMPEATNEQARMQQSMMKYMTLFMGVIFYKVAAGLCLYFIVSSLWGIVERKLLPRATPATDTGASKGTSGSGGSSGGDSGGGSRPPRSDRDNTPPRNGSPKSKKRQKARRKK
jgi:YidC/Oxa1 family membrane protein insertase